MSAAGRDAASRPVTVASWTGATWIGWVLGIPCVALLALAGEAVGIGGNQSLVGAGMGCGVGLLQLRSVRRLQLRAAPWFWSSTGGMAVPFLVFDLGHRLGATWPYSLPVCVALGGVVTGAWQAALLRQRFAGSAWWIAASALGWALGGAAASGADAVVRAHAIRGLAGALAYLGLVMLGGPVLGLATGLVAVRVLRPHDGPTLP